MKRNRGQGTQTRRCSNAGKKRSREAVDGKKKEKDTARRRAVREAEELGATRTRDPNT